MTAQLNALTNHSVEEAHYLGQWLTFLGGGVEGQLAERTAQMAIHEDVCGGPVQTAWFDAQWRTSDVVGLAKSMYDSSDYSAMPILADALQDAGCQQDAVLEHCRGDTPHVRGCWVVDVVLQHRSAEARLRQFGMIDPLTGVGNGRACSLVLRQLVLDRASLLAIEIDSFAPFVHTHAQSWSGRSSQSAGFSGAPSVVGDS